MSEITMKYSVGQRVWFSSPLKNDSDHYRDMDYDEWWRSCVNRNWLGRHSGEVVEVIVLGNSPLFEDGRYYENGVFYRIRNNWGRETIADEGQMFANEKELNLHLCRHYLEEAGELVKRIKGRIEYLSKQEPRP